MDAQKGSGGRGGADTRGSANDETIRTQGRRRKVPRWHPCDLVRGTYVDPRAGQQSFESFGDEWAEAQDWKSTGPASHGGPYELGSTRCSARSRFPRSIGWPFKACSNSSPRCTALDDGRHDDLRRDDHARRIRGGRIGRDPTSGYGGPRPAGVSLTAESDQTRYRRGMRYWRSLRRRPRFRAAIAPGSLACGSARYSG